jgi:hypothetical protein
MVYGMFVIIVFPFETFIGSGTGLETNVLVLLIFVLKCRTGSCGVLE